MLPPDGMIFFVTKVTIILEVVLTVVGSKVIDKDYREAGSSVTCAAFPVTDESTPILPIKELETKAGIGFNTFPMEITISDIKVFVVIAPLNSIVLIVVAKLSHVKVVMGAELIIKNRQVSVPVKVVANYCGN